MNKLQWNLNRNSYIFIQENAFEDVAWKMASILSRPQCAKYQKSEFLELIKVFKHTRIGDMYFIREILAYGWPSSGLLHDTKMWLDPHASLYIVDSVGSLRPTDACMMRQ